MNKAALRTIPSVEKVLQALGQTELPRPLVVLVTREELAAVRKEGKAVEFDAVLSRIRGATERLRLSRIRNVTNGTGILIHTNLGRAPMAAEAVAAFCGVAGGYCNLEFDLTTGARGGRATYVERALALVCGAEAATVVNNCAAALVLMLRHFTGGERKEVVISRGELVQIGGGFRIPEILETSGARLREIGATNKTSLVDYSRAIGRETALILKVHRSNFFMGGFVESPTTEEIAALARRKRVPFVEDLGSGAVVDTEQFPGVEHEPTPAEVLKCGVKLVCFSGDKLFGGPQAGIIAGNGRLVGALKRDPFFRALRCDKLILAALQATAELYLNGAGSKRQGQGADKTASGPMAPSLDSLPLLSMLATPVEELRARAIGLVQRLERLPVKVSVGESQAQVGGGTLPRTLIPSVTVEMSPTEMSVEELARRLRSIGVIGYISNNRFLIDLRTIPAYGVDLIFLGVRIALSDPRSQSS